MSLETLKRLAPTLSVGVASANMMSLGDELAELDGTGVGILHFDVMDGCFCPFLTVGPQFIKGVKTGLLKDVHLMIVDPLTKLGDYVNAGADIITVHLESEPTHIHRVLQSLGQMTNVNDPNRGIVRGLAINPGTSVHALEPLLDEVELVTILAVNPGWGGQKFIDSTNDRLALARRMIEGRDILLGVDGGVTKSNIAEIAQMGMDLVVTGSAVFDGKAPAENAKFMLNTLRGK